MAVFVRLTSDEPRKRLPTQEPGIELRELTDADVGLVAKSWVESMRGARNMRSIDQALFGKWAYGLVQRLLPRCQVTIAANPNNTDDIYGFRVSQGAYLHLAYVRAPWRRKGVARRLMGKWAPGSTVLTWWTRDVNDWAWEKWPGMKFVPVWMLDQPGEHDGRAEVAVQ